MGANLALARAKAYVPEFDVEAAANEFPELKVGGSRFTKEDLTNCVKETRTLPTLLATKMDTKKYQSCYSMDIERINAPKDQPFEIIRLCRKRPFAPDVDSSVIVSGTSDFHLYAQLDGLTKNNILKRTSRLLHILAQNVKTSRLR